MMTRKARTQYVVLLQDGQWRVSRHGKLHGPHPTQAVAIRSAIDVAHASSLNERHSQVLTKEADGSFGVQWTFGDDPYPPLA